jgi:hypothetical protein
MFGRFFEALSSFAGANEFVGLSARGFVAGRLTRSHAIDLGGRGGGYVD